MGIEITGLATGLTGTPKEYPQLYKYAAQLDAARKQAKDDKIDDIVSKVAVSAGKDLHRLEVEPMRLRTAKFISDAAEYKRSEDVQGFMKALTDYQADLNQAQNRSAYFNSLEKTNREAAAGNKYLFKNQKQAYGLMLNSASTADWLNALEQNQIQRNQLFDYDQNGNIAFSTVDKYDINKSVKDLVNGNKIIIGRNEYKDPNTKATMIEQVVGIPMDDEEATYLSTLKDANGNPITPGLTAKGIAESLLQNPAIAAQYIDEYNLEGMSPDEVFNHFYENQVVPNVKRQQTTKAYYEKKGITVNVNSDKVKSYSFTGGPNPGLYYHTAGSSLVVDSPYSVPFAPKEGEKGFRITPSKGWLKKKDGFSMDPSESSGEILVNYVNVLPYIVVDGVKKVSSVQKSIEGSPNKKVRYAPFIEGKLIKIKGGVEEITNADYYTEFTTAIIPNFRNKMTDSNQRTAFNRDINILNKVVKELNETGKSPTVDSLQ